MPSSFSPATDIPDLSGKVIIVTGGNSGLGAATVRALAAHNPECVYLCARTRSTADSVVRSIPTNNVEILDCDFSSFDSIKKCAAAFQTKANRLDTLILNAGVSPGPSSITKDGYETSFETNYLGHALFTQILLPTMLRTQKTGAETRIVSISSIGGQRSPPKGGLRLEDVKSDMSSYGSFALYGQSKLAQILWARKMAEVYPSITSVSIHPGAVKTEITRGLTQKSPWFGWFLRVVFGLIGSTPEEGAKTQLWAATGRKEGPGGVKNGYFYMPIGKTMKESEYATSKELKDKLWEWTDRELVEHDGPGWPSAKS